MILAVVGINGWAPFIASAVITTVAAIPLLMVRSHPSAFADQQRASIRAISPRAPLILSAVALFGLYESALITLLPIWGVRIGLSDRLAAATVSAIYLGSLFLQIPIGWTSDRLSRRAVLRLRGAVGLVGAGIPPLVSGMHIVLFAVLLLWGGVASGIYPIALSMAGDRFRDDELVAVNAALISAYGLGALAGPVLGGAAMDAWNPQGLAGFFVMVYCGFTLAIGWRATR